MLYDLYETRYGIYNHLANKNRPLASVAFHPAEEVNPNSRLQRSLDAYADYKIGDFWNISWHEFINQPSDIVEMQVESAKKRLAKRDKEEDELKDLLKGKPPTGKRK